MNRTNTGLFGGGTGSKSAFALARTVAPDVSMAPADIRRTKGALHRLGHYRPPAWGITGIVDSALFDGLKAF